MKKFLLIFTLLTTTTILAKAPNPYTIKVLTHKELEPLLPFVAQLRVDIFKNYPYLYDGDIQEEMDDLQKYAQDDNSALAIAYRNDTPIGFLGGSDLTAYSWHFENSVPDMFKNAGLNPQEYYYFTDVIILPEHRGNGLSPQLFKALEKYAQNKGSNGSCFITEHHENHPLKPDNHKSLVPLWNGLNYKKSTLITYASWPTHQADGTIKQERHPLVFWFKNLAK